MPFPKRLLKTGRDRRLAVKVVKKFRKKFEREHVPLLREEVPNSGKDVDCDAVGAPFVQFAAGYWPPPQISSEGE